MKYILGVDPGLDGAIALIDPTTKLAVMIEKMPRLKRGGRSDLDLPALAFLINAYAPQIKFAVVEDVASAPKQGVASMFTFGKVTGIVVGMIAANNIKVFYAKPSVWKFQMKLTKDKKKSIKMANDLYFKDVAQISHDGIAEAVLLAHFGKRFDV